QDVYIAGRATDYCVKFTALDACHVGFNVHLVTAGCRGVNLKPDDSKYAIEEMRAAGISIE
ncbi:MAG: isochorismatase family protein, partial [Verrucomicrobiota bacterium]